MAVDEVFTSPLIFEDVKAWAAPRIDAYGFNPPVNYGPFYSEMVTKGPGPFVFFMVGSGAGLNDDGVFDRPFISVRTVGRSQDYAGAERVALITDRVLCSFASSGPFGVEDRLWANYITRSGGRPALVLQDSAERYHFTCSYITEVESGF